MSFPRYERYKDSGVEWLGEVPGHWEVKALRALAREGRKTFVDGDWIESPFITDEGIRLIQTGNIGVGNYKEQGFRYISEDTFDEFACTEIEVGDILICRLAEPVGRACLAPHLDSRMITSVDVCILKPREDVDARFLVYLLSSKEYLGFMEGQCRGGTRDRVSRSFLGSVRVSLPGLFEQQNIAAFLERETDTIDALIAEQRHLIDLLKEKRQAVISHAVTKGLNPDAPMKDSGVEWLGKVPEHWKIAALNYRFEIALGKMLDEKRITGKHLAPYLRNVDVQWGKINTNDLPEMDFSGDDLERYSLKKGDLLVCEGGDVGRAAVWDGDVEECYYQKALHRLRPRCPANDSPQFMFYQLQASAKNGRFAESGGKATIAHLTAEALRRYLFPFPPVGEQHAIVAFLDRETARIDTLVANAETAIALLQERRIALISAAVTGKIDVRGLVGVREAVPAGVGS